MTSSVNISTRTDRLPELDGFRGLSILAVLAAHMLPLNTAGYELNGMSGLMGMSVFFALSGFLITRFLLQRPDIGPFLVRRFARIVPLIAAFSIIYCGLIYSRWDSVLFINLYVINYTHSAMFPGMTPLWSVALEMQFYIGIALLVFVLGRRAFWLIPFFAIGITLLRIHHGVSGSILTHYRIDEILAGSLLAMLWLNADDRRLAGFIRVLPLPFWPLFGLWLLSCYPGLTPFSYARPYATAGMMGAVIFSSGQWQHRFLSLGSLRYIATVSFALYVWHSSFLFGWFETDSDWERYLIMRPIAVVMTFTIAHISTFYFERPINDWAHRMTSQPRQRPA